MIIYKTTGYILPSERQNRMTVLKAAAGNRFPYMRIESGETAFSLHKLYKTDLKHLIRLKQIGDHLYRFSDRIADYIFEQSTRDDDTALTKSLEDINIVIEEEITAAAREIADKFLEAAAKKYLDIYYRTIYRAQAYRNAESGEPFETPDFPPIDEYLEIVEKQVSIYKELRDMLIPMVQARVTDRMSREEIREIADKICQREYASMQDVIQGYEITGALRALKTEQIAYFQYVCFDPHTACTRCAELNGKYFKVSEGRQGVNLPPMHPNCKCTIGSYLGDVAEESAFNGFKSKIIEQLSKDKLATDLYAWVHLLPQKVDEYKDYLLGYLGESVSIYINKNTYTYDKENQKNAVFVNGKLLNIENLTDIDLRLLELMKQMDSMTERGTAYADILREAHTLMAENQGKFSVDFFKHYSYYELGRDVTQELYDLMDEYAEFYKSHIDSGDLEIFLRLVANKMELDLKNRPQYQNSAFIFEGEIVDQDALGNIVYGYIGRMFGIPENKLFVGAGYAQQQSGTSSDDFKDTQGDDPRDQYRILQGMWWYENDRKNKTAS